MHACLREICAERPVDQQPCVCPCSEHLLHLLVNDLGVQLGETLALLRQVVKRAVVALSVTMLGAVDEGALAGHLHEANLLVALPTLVLVSLIKQTQTQISVNFN